MCVCVLLRCGFSHFYKTVNGSKKQFVASQVRKNGSIRMSTKSSFGQISCKVQVVKAWICWLSRFKWHGCAGCQGMGGGCQSR